jgi:hypothetical protein
MRAFVRVPGTGHVMTVHATEQTTVGALKSVIFASAQVDIAPDMQQLYYGHRRLDVRDYMILIMLLIVDLSIILIIDARIATFCMCYPAPITFTLYYGSSSPKTTVLTS